MDTNCIQAIMSKSGPIVKTVFLRSNGDVEEVEIDMTPSKNELVTVMGGQATIIGQFEVIDVVLMKLKETNTQVNKINTHKIPHPFHEESHLGDILLVKMNQDADPEHFSVSDWQSFLQTAPHSAEAYSAWRDLHKLDEDNGELSVQEEEEVNACIERLTSSLGRIPTKLEIYTDLNRRGLGLIGNKLEAEEEEDSDSDSNNNNNNDNNEDEGEEDNEDEEDNDDEDLKRIFQELEDSLGRAPTEEEMLAKLHEFELKTLLTEEEEKLVSRLFDDLEVKLGNAPSQEEIFKELARLGKVDLIEKLQQEVDQDGDDEDDDENSDEDDVDLTEAEQAFVQDLSKKLTKKLKRNPTEDEILTALSRDPIGMGILHKLMKNENDQDDEEEEEEIFILPKRAAVEKQASAKGQKERKPQPPPKRQPQPPPKKKSRRG